MRLTIGSGNARKDSIEFATGRKTDWRKNSNDMQAVMRQSGVKFANKAR